MNLNLPLKGLLVLDFTQLIAGPSAAMLLAELGASVLKVERLSGEIGRHIGSKGPGGSSVFDVYNRGKGSLALDLQDRAHRQLIQELIPFVDILLEGFTPGVMDKLGLSADRLHELNKRLVYVSLSGFGQQAGRRPGVDSVVQAESGMMSLTGEERSVPTKVGFQIVDGATGLALTQAVLAALLSRERSDGVGCRIECSLLDVALFLQSPPFAQASGADTNPSRLGNTSGSIGAPSDAFKCKDGKYILISAYLPEQWIKVCSVLELQQLTRDSRFATPEARIDNKNELHALFRQQFLLKDRQDWFHILDSAGVICGRVLDTLEVLDAYPDRMQPIDSAAGHHARVPKSPIRYSCFELQPLRKAPNIGAGALEILDTAGVPNALIRRFSEIGNQ